MSAASTPDLAHKLRNAAMGLGPEWDYMRDAADRLEANTAEMLDLQRRLGEDDENHARVEAKAAALADLEAVRVVLGAMEGLPTPMLTVEVSEAGHFAVLAWGDAVTDPDYDPDTHEHTFAEARGDSIAAALAALAGVVEAAGAPDPDAHASG